MRKRKHTLSYPDRKISETFLEFAAPLLDVGDGSKRAFEEALKIAFTAWNAVVLADVRDDDQHLVQIRKLIADRPGDSRLVEGLIERKRTHFGDDPRLIGEYRVRRTEDGFNLWAEARHPALKGQRMQSSENVKDQSQDKRNTAPDERVLKSSALKRR